jgi:hypothetical protein
MAFTISGFNNLFAIEGDTNANKECFLLLLKSTVYELWYNVS